MLSPLLAGASAGGLHAVSGPDHLAALLPLAVGSRWHQSCRVGAVWGVGHGLGASSMGALAWVANTLIGGESITGTAVDTASDWMEVAVGVTLVIIGIMGLRSASVPASFPWQTRQNSTPQSIEDSDLEGGCSGSHDLPDAHGHSHAYSRMGPRAMLFTGIVHGFSGSGHLLGVIPALLLSRSMAMVYLTAFCAGTCLAMCIFTGAIGEATFVLGQQLHRPDLPNTLARYSSVVTLIVGVSWILKAWVTVAGA